MSCLLPTMKGVVLAGLALLMVGALEQARAAAGGGKHDELTLGCDVSPVNVYAGDPVTVIANPLNVRPKKEVSYSWSSTAGSIAPTPNGAVIMTLGLAAGEYTVTGKLTQGKKHAECTETFKVKPAEPTTVTCSADPVSVKSGDPVTITAVGGGAGRRTLTYSFSADNGQIAGTGDKVQLATAGVTAGTINVTCNVMDDRGKTATATTMVAVTVPKSGVLPVLADVQTLCGVTFEHDRRRPVRVDNEAKACLDDIALTLQRQSDAKLVVVGSYGKGETVRFGKERALNVRQYLTDEKGIEAGRIDVRVGEQSGREVQDVLVPAGVSYSGGGQFDPAKVKRMGQAYGKASAAGATPRRKVRRRPRPAVARPTGYSGQPDYSRQRPVARPRLKGKRYTDAVAAAAAARAAGQVAEPR